MKNVYFIGIGGIGMSAIARYFKHAGCNVSGYDRTPTKLTAALEAEGIRIHYEERPDLIPTEIDETLVIYTPAIPAQMKELVMVFEKGYRVVKRSRALGEIASSQKCLAISGTHGKTTTSTLLAHILNHSGEGCNAFLGGISKNYHTNLLLSKNPVLVAEADEFDRSFLQLFPDIAAITSCDADHLDIYSDHDHVKGAFREFASQVKEALVVRKGVDVEFETKARIYTYSYDEQADFYASEIKVDECGYFHFTLHYPMGEIEDCTVGIPGWINVENGIAAAAVALLHGTSPQMVKSALATFSGVERRFDIHLNTHKCSYIDDYAHHPKEISAAISSIRNIFPGRRLCAIFQPHLFTRTRDFYREFAESLSALDELILLPIYPARELPIEGVSSEMILELVTIPDKKIVSKEELMKELESRDIDILITLGAGDINTFIEPITELLNKRIG
ncbi:MAG: UDP-N-acetylmuramate--L-alanine ligase [Bacteroidales bacterium]|nr:UDP-N-acetylmuramate--L-alanine ligase [Bacteroidales bacterium]